jgi:hypothetical protein
MDCRVFLLFYSLPLSPPKLYYYSQDPTSSIILTSDLSGLEDVLTLNSPTWFLKQCCSLPPIRRWFHIPSLLGLPRKSIQFFLWSLSDPELHGKRHQAPLAMCHWPILVMSPSGRCDPHSSSALHLPGPWDSTMSPELDSHHPGVPHSHSF